MLLGDYCLTWLCTTLICVVLVFLEVTTPVAKRDELRVDSLCWLALMFLDVEVDLCLDIWRA